MLKLTSGADSRHFFFQRPRIGPVLASLGLNLVCLAFLWSQSLNSPVSSGVHRSSAVKVTMLGGSYHREEVVGLPKVPTDKPNTSVASTGSVVLGKRDPTSASGPEQPSAAEEAVIESPPASTPIPSVNDNASLAIPSQLNFPFQLRRRGMFESPPRAPQTGPPGSGNSMAEQQWRRQNAQADMQRQVMINLLAELNKEAKPNASMTCQTRPKVVCSTDYEPALVILRRYEVFFTDPNLRENFSFRFTEGRWSVDSKASP